MYHHINVVPARGTQLRGMVVSPERFRAHMRSLAALGWQGLSMAGLMPYLDGTLTGRVFGITFDDGYVNNLDHAAPVLAELGFSATCYAVSGLLGRTNQWDAGLCVPASALMDASQLRQWHALGMDVGSHTQTHCRLGSVGSEQARAEIVGSKRDLEDAVGAPVRHFCYPYGDYLPEHAEWVAAAGYDSATTVRRARARIGASRYELPRVLMARSTHLLHLLLKMYTRYEDREGAPS